MFFGTEMGEKKAILVGNGTMGGRHRSRFEANGVRFVKVLDKDASSWLESEEFSQILLSEKSRPDFAVIASPASSHYQYAKLFLEHRIPVLVEKPLADSTEKANELVEISTRNETLLFVAQSECYNPLFLNFRKHLLLDLKNAAASRDAYARTEPSPLNVKLEFRREHGYSERCRDVDVSLDLLIHDVSLFLNIFDSRDVTIVSDPVIKNCCNDDRVRMRLKVISGAFAGVEADFIADRNSERDVRQISVKFGQNGSESGFEYSVSLAHYTDKQTVVHVPDSLDNEHQFFMKLLAGACKDWAVRALHNAADSVVMILKEVR